MTIVGGLDIHRKQITFDYVEVETGRWERGRIMPADREHLAGWLSRFDGMSKEGYGRPDSRHLSDAVVEADREHVRRFRHRGGHREQPPA